MLKKISIIGGDLRNIELAKLYASENTTVYTYGFDNFFEKREFENENIQYMKNNLIKCSTVLECVNASNYIISAIPLSKDWKSINAPYIDEKIDLKDVINVISEKNFVAGVIENDVEDVLVKNKNKVIDLMKNETLTIYNAIATVEGAIAKIIANTNITLYKSNILILGFGRIGKILANRLENFGANVFCEARKEKDFAWINTLGYIPVDLEYLEKFVLENEVNIIINTVPNLILTKKVLEKLNQEIYILDLASKPGGVDVEYAKNLGLSVEHYLGVPGKIASKSLAKFIKEELEKSCFNTEK